MSLFGNSTLSTIFYIFAIAIVFCVSFKLKERLDLYIKNIPKKKRNFCHNFLSNNLIQVLVFSFLGFTLLKFIIDPAITVLFPTVAAVGGYYKKVNTEPITYNEESTEDLSGGSLIEEKQPTDIIKNNDRGYYI